MDDVLKNRGRDRESGLGKDAYFSDNYFDFQQLCSQAHQIYRLGKFRNGRVLEVGIGNGLVSDFLRRAGCDVTTIDINPDLDPDICCDISDIPTQLSRSKFDVVVACEVLEHLPFDEFEKSISTFKQVSEDLYLTLPNYKRSFGLGGFLKLFPRAGYKSFSAFFDLPNNKVLDSEHFWEIGSHPYSSKKAVADTLSRVWNKSVYVQPVPVNPYHIEFSTLPL